MKTGGKIGNKNLNCSALKAEKVVGNFSKISRNMYE